MRFFPIAKVNIGLNVVGKRPDGYHELQTVFYPIREICDILDVELDENPTAAQENNGTNGRLTLNLVGAPIECDVEKNLVWKAYHLLAKDYQLPPMRATLEKRIPMQAGIGGGSSDAAEMLKAVNLLAKLGLTDDELEAYALKLGADVPFFIRCLPCYATGVGEKMTPIQLSLEKDYEFRIVKPDVSVSTAEAFRNIPIAMPEVSCRDIVCNSPISEWKESLRNDFETTVFAKYPELAEIKQTFYNQGAVFASMTGSGSAIFGIFKKK